MRALTACLALLVCMPSAALACSSPSYSESGLRIQADRLAERMVAAAAFIEVVVVDSITPWDTTAFFAKERAEALASARPEWASAIAADYDVYQAEYQTLKASTVTFRAVEILKGSPQQPFSAGAFVTAHENADYDLADMTDRIPASGPLPSADDLYNWYPITDLNQHGGRGSCSTPIAVRPNGRYLLFRAADGELLRGALPTTTTTLRRRGFSVDGPNFEAVSEPHDLWLDQVRAAVINTSGH